MAHTKHVHHCPAQAEEAHKVLGHHHHKSECETLNSLTA